MRRAFLCFVGFVSVIWFLLSVGMLASAGGWNTGASADAGRIWHVSTSGNDYTGDGSQLFPFRTIQKGIDVSNHGDTVLVERGVYVENINFSSKSILVASQVILDGLESTVESTVIDGNYEGSVVTFDSGEDLSSVIRGFTITRGCADYGSGIYCLNSSPTIAENFVLDDSCQNWAAGPGICCIGSNAKICRNLIAGCYGAAAVFVTDGSDVEMVNNTICDNVCGALSIQWNSNAFLRSNVICYNGPYGIHSDWDGSANILYGDVYGQETNYVGEIGDWTGILGNISASPLFVDHPGGDYHLTVGSPCRDAGDPGDSVPPGGGDRVDMGAFEYLITGPDFCLTVVPETTTIEVGDSTSFRLIVTGYFGFSSTVNLTYSELPPEVGGLLDPGQVTPTDSSVFRISTSSSASPGTYPILITATGGELIREKEVVLVIVPPPYNGPVWHVSTSGHDSWAFANGSAALPFRTIQKAINVAEHGDTVLVGKGRYFEGPNFLGKRILVASHFIFDGLESSIDSTIIDGNGVGPVVSFVTYEDSNSVIRGFTITGGNTANGGAICCNVSSPTIADNFIVDNTADGGAAIYCYFSDCHMYRNLIANCSGPATIWLAYVCSTRMVNNTLCDNDGGALSIQSRSRAYVKNCIFYDNGPYGIHAANNSSADVLYSDLFLNDENYAGDMEDQTGINGNISAYPFFVNPAAGDYHLSEVSPCVDAGDPADSVPLGGGDHIDMGAFECITVPEFTITAIPDTAAVRQGDSTTIKLILRSYGFSSPVDLSFSELPPGVSGSLSSDQLVPTDSSVLTVHAQPDVPIGEYSVVITADGGDVIQQMQVMLYVGMPWFDRSLWHVSMQGHDFCGDGSGEHPFRTIQKGIDDASHADTVLVNSGLYMENTNFRGKAILVASHFILDGSEYTITSTVIDGNRQGNVVAFDSGEDSNSVIRGFTITGGYAAKGAGIYCCGSSPVIADNFVVDDSSDSGNGPGIYCRESSAKIRRNVISRCYGYGAVTLHQVGDVQLVNNTICDNSWGGLSGQGDLIQGKNNILYGNTAYGIHSAGSTWDLSYNDIYANDNDYLGVPDQTGISGNISADPLFMNASSGDYRLTESSPCIDTGDPADSVPPGGGDRIDMGAFEYPYEFVNGDANGDGAVTANDVVYLLNYLFREGSPPYPTQAGDANHDGDVNAADIVYLIQYLYRGGPPPGEGSPEAQPILAREAQPSARIWLSNARAADAEETIEIFVRGSFDLDIAAVQLAIQYDPQSLSLNPALPSNLQALQVYFSQKDGLLKAGVLDLKGENWISAGRKVDILFIQIEGPNLSTLRIKEAVLADRSGYVVPVKIVTQEEIQEHRPESFSLSQNYPNPFNPQTQIRYALPQNCDVKITVYNLLGQRVRVLVDEHQSAGYKTVHWDGKDEQGNDLASGIYFCKIRAGEFTDGKKMILIK